ncbi:CRISPR-associated exonuclease Cas4 [Paenibacillus forsythiae]|uniref:CRISPR-associated exonuclease Cas4 n=1 Tax=Paenibacillus forsythiae TaxID=365616 RepID=A0ABU3H5Z8_9BACL|nr:CRISPR-associated exonuclease Cas4 [Paenibacillus forsythiae]
MIHVEQQWADNIRTYEGDLLHRKADNPALRETRGKIIISRAMPLISRKLGITGTADVVEFHAAEEDDPPDCIASLTGRRGKWKPYPVEYKRGKPKVDDCDEVQLCAQAMCLEEMLGVKIGAGSLFYGQQERRQEVLFTEDLRCGVIDYLDEMRSCFNSGITPAGKYNKACKSCSLHNICLPKLRKGSVSRYMDSFLEGE